MPTTRQLSFAAGCFIAAGTVLWNGFPAYPTDNSANRLLRDERPQDVQTLRGEIRPLNYKDASLARVFRAFVVVTPSGEKVTVRCANHNWRATCFDSLPGGAPQPGKVHELTVAWFEDHSAVENAPVLVQLADERGNVLMPKREILLAAHGWPSTTRLLLAAIFAIAGAVGLAVPWKPARRRSQDTGHGWFPPSP